MMISTNETLLAERVQQLERSILNVEKDIFFSQNMTELLQNNRKRKSKENADGTSMSSTKEIASSPETVQPYGQEDQENQEVDDAGIDKIIVNKVSALLFSNLNLEEIWIKVMDQLKKDNLRVQSIEFRTNVEWNRILNVSDYSQLFIKSRKKLSKDKINDDVRQLLRDGTDRIIFYANTDWFLFSHCCLRREVNVLILKHREHDFIVKILGPIIGTLLEESDIGIFELNWIEKESHSVTSRKRKAVHEEYKDLTTSMKQMDLIVTLRSYKNTLRSKLHFKEAELEGVFTLGIQITDISWTIYSLSYDSSQNFYFFVEMATLILPTTLSDMEDLLPSFLETLSHIT
ncbi:hypothetical protein F8M41_005376 [Gigaspora margarita]|uniref:Uncharacterized protein n=1 Tax=Gigaspora margarita TaxID=4874 RepID=A0A8H4A6W7_GIGMA|nr:hypothetical protein F8M41_005376 [Gigaspora margarita]